MTSPSSTKRHLNIAADEFYRSPLFMLGAIGLTDHQFRVFERRWLQLRQEIKSQLLADAPRLVEHKKLKEDQLPEIHAVELFQSDSYYRLKNSDPGWSPDYWKRQYEWIERALQIISALSPRIFFLPMIRTAEDIAIKREMEKEYYVSQYPSPKNKKRAEIYSRLLSQPYYSSLPILLSGLDNYLSEHGFSSTMLFDDYDHSKGFHEGGTLDYLRESGEINSDFTAEHASSVAHNILQAADVVTYVRGRLRHSQIAEKSAHEQMFARWDRRYVRPHCVSDAQDVQFSTSAAVSIHLMLQTTLCTPHEMTSMTPAEVKAQVDAHTGNSIGSLLLRNLLNEPEPARKLAPSGNSLLESGVSVNFSLKLMGTFRSDVL